MLRKLLILSGVLFSISATNTAQANKPVSEKSLKHLRAGVVWQREQAWHWQDISLVQRTKTSYSENKAHSRPYLRWLSHTWNKRRGLAKRYAQNPPHYNEWMCIHGYEGAWNDPNAPYYGGLQMDISFQRAHGWDALQRWGTADNWNPLTQMWVAERAYRGLEFNNGTLYQGSARGFYPWPNTARYCGLL